MSFRALVVSKDADGQKAEIRQVADGEMLEGEVLIEVAFSTLNYKDGLALTGAAPILRRLPMIPGIDLAGTVLEPGGSQFAPGDKVVVNGFGLGEAHHGGYAQRARVDKAWPTKLPEAFSLKQAMMIGTAGYTAMLCVMALERHGLNPAASQDRPVLVTGAAGGVGSIALALLARLGYRTAAATGRPGEAPYLKTLGASEIIDRAEFTAAGRPLASERFAGAVDAVGSHTLANVLAQTAYGGCVAACGLAQGMDLPGSVLPFILRGVTLAGIDSVMAPQSLRQKAWARLARDLDPARLEAAAAQNYRLEDLPGLARQILAGAVRGRVVVDVNA